MSGSNLTLGQAIDQILGALTSLDEAGRRTALAAVCMQLGINEVRMHRDVSAPQPHASKPASSEDLTPLVSVPQRASVDIRSLKDQKKPNSARQMACVVGFFLQELAPEGERKDVVTVQDLEKYFKQAGYKLPLKMGQVLVDVKNAGHMDSVGRGEYKLNAVGYNLVAHKLPAGTE